MVSTRPSSPITTPPPARSWPSVSAERAVAGTVARTPTTAFKGLVLGRELALGAASDCAAAGRPARQSVARDRKSGGWGKSGSVRVDLGGRGRIKKKKHKKREQK